MESRIGNPLVGYRIPHGQRPQRRGWLDDHQSVSQAALAGPRDCDAGGGRGWAATTDERGSRQGNSGNATEARLSPSQSRASRNASHQHRCIARTFAISLRDAATANAKRAIGNRTRPSHRKHNRKALCDKPDSCFQKGGGIVRTISPRAARPLQRTASTVGAGKLVPPNGGLCGASTQGLVPIKQRPAVSRRGRWTCAEVRADSIRIACHCIRTMQWPLRVTGVTVTPRGRAPVPCSTHGPRLATRHSYTIGVSWWIGGNMTLAHKVSATPVAILSVWNGTICQPRLNRTARPRGGRFGAEASSVGYAEGYDGRSTQHSVYDLGYAGSTPARSTDDYDEATNDENAASPVCVSACGRQPGGRDRG